MDAYASDPSTFFHHVFRLEGQWLQSKLQGLHCVTLISYSIRIPDLDIYRSANVLVKHRGPDAPSEAAMRADAMLEKGDLDGYAVWKRILRAVEELQREIATAGDQIH